MFAPDQKVLYVISNTEVTILEIDETTALVELPNGNSILVMVEHLQEIV
jgi:sRNA-binding protein